MNPPKEKKQRQRDSLRLSEKGQSLVREALSLKCWSREKWIQMMGVYVSISTVKRFLKGEKIDRGYFESMCSALCLHPEELIAPPNDQLDCTTSSIPLLIPSLLIAIPPEQSFAQHSDTHFQSFMITGTFSPNKLAEIKVTLAHLEKLLHSDCTFTLRSEKNYLAVSGKFSEDKKLHVEVALMHLEKLLLEHCITPGWME